MKRSRLEAGKRTFRLTLHVVRFTNDARFAQQLAEADGSRPALIGTAWTCANIVRGGARGS